MAILKHIVGARVVPLTDAERHEAKQAERGDPAPELTPLTHRIEGLDGKAGSLLVRPAPDDASVDIFVEYAVRSSDVVRSAESAVLLFHGRYSEEFYWLYDGRVYRTDDRDLEPADVRALANEIVNRRRLKIEKAHALQAMAEQLEQRVRRERIPQEVKVAVWQRDKGACVECESREDLEFDHVIPLAMGGSNTARNLQLLCATCNRRKGATLG